MSVLIKGLSIPKEDTMLLRINTKGEVYVFGGYPTKIFDAIYIPAHGDLIDRDEAADDACLIWGRNSSGDDATQEIIEHLRKMKAVIPAERSEDG